MSRRLLVLCYFYPPLAGGGVHRVLAWTRHLPAHGWACTVVCAGEGDYWVTDASLVERIPRETRVERVQGGSGLSALLSLRGRRAGGAGRRSGAAFGALRRLSDFFLVPDSYAGWSRRAARVAQRLASSGRFDAVLSSSPPGIGPWKCEVYDVMGWPVAERARSRSIGTSGIDRVSPRSP